MTNVGVEFLEQPSPRSRSRHNAPSIAIVACMDARDLLHGLNPKSISALCRVSIHTARRWKKSGRVPGPHARVLELLIAGHLGALGSTWSGWSVRGADLVTPEGWRVSPGEIRAIPYRDELVRELRRALTQPQQWELNV